MVGNVYIQKDKPILTLVFSPGKQHSQWKVVSLFETTLRAVPSIPKK